jgi:cytochrome c-type biogenesis protein CcmH/NrfG
MFFPRLRRQARWMFVFLALAFGVGFVIFGVGSSLPSGVADLIKSNGTSQEASIGEAQDKVAKDPKDAQAQLELSRAYQRDGQMEKAIAPLVAATKIEPKNQDFLQELAGLYTTQAQTQQNIASAANQEYQAASGITSLTTGTTQQIFQAGALDQTILDDVSKRGQEANGKASTALNSTMTTYGKLTKLRPRDSQMWLLYASAAQAAGKTDNAITGYKTFLKLSPDDPSAAQVKAQIKSLQQTSNGVVSSGGITRINR